MTINLDHSSPVLTDTIVSGLIAHSELVKKLVYDIETDQLNHQDLKYRIFEIQSHIKKLRKVV